MGLVITVAVLMALLLLFTKVKQALARGARADAEGDLQRHGAALWCRLLAGLYRLDGATYLLLVLMLVCNYDLPQANALRCS